jgi:hypothetical protein
MEEKEPKIGDIYYVESHLSNIRVAAVQRITNTQVVMSDGNRLRKPLSSDNRPIGHSGWNVSSYRHETPELKEAYNRQELMVFISRFDQDGRLKTLSTENLNRIKEIMTNN